MPSFFTLAISQSLLPVISKDYVNNNFKSIKRKIKIAITLSLVIAIPINIVLFINPKLFLNLIYHTNEGILYIKILIPFCILQYIESILSSILDATNNSKINMYATTISTTVRTLTLIILLYFKLGIWSLIISIILNIVITTIYLIKKVRQCLTY